MSLPSTAADVPRPAPPVRRFRVEIAPETMWMAALVIAAVWGLLHLLPVLLVVIAASMLVGALNPVVGWLERRHWRRTVAILTVFLFAVGLIGLLLFLAVPPLIAQVQGIVEREPEIRAHVVQWLQRSPLTATLAEQINQLNYTELLQQSRGRVLSATTRAFEVVALLVATFFLALYIMIDRDRLRGAIFAVVPRRHHIRFSRVLLNLELIVGGYIRGQLITCILMSGFILGLLLICHVPNALAIAVFGGVMDVLPYVGPLLTIAPAVIAAYSVGPGVAAGVFVGLLLYEEFESRVLVPLVYGKSLRLPASMIFVSLLIGAALGGIVGALLALPLAAAIVMLVEELRVDLPGETEQPEDRVTRLKDEVQEKEYEARTEKKPVEKAAAIAVEIAKERKEEETQEAETQRQEMKDSKAEEAKDGG